MGIFNSKSVFREMSKSDIIRIVLIVTILFVLLQFIRISMLLNANSDAAFYTYIWNKLTIPSDVKTFIRQPWSLFTYFFLEGNFMGIVGNMIWLWIFGSVIEDLKGPNRILPIFITGGVMGGLFMLLFSLTRQPLPQFFEGTSACIMAVAFATLTFKPGYRFWMFFGIGIPIWVFVLLFIGLRLASVQLGNLPYLFILLGGFTAGMLYTKGLDRYYEWFTSILKRSGTVLDNKNFVLTKNPSASVRARSEQLTVTRIQITPSRIDAILDKINEKGINSLTKEEKRMLDEYSQGKKDH